MWTKNKNLKVFVCCKIVLNIQKKEYIIIFNQKLKFYNITIFFVTSHHHQQQPQQQHNILLLFAVEEEEEGNDFLCLLLIGKEEWKKER